MSIVLPNIWFVIGVSHLQHYLCLNLSYFPFIKLATRSLLKRFLKSSFILLPVIAQEIQDHLSCHKAGDWNDHQDAWSIGQAFKGTDHQFVNMTYCLFMDFVFQINPFNSNFISPCYKYLFFKLKKTVGILKISVMLYYIQNFKR